MSLLNTTKQTLLLVQKLADQNSIQFQVQNHIVIFASENETKEVIVGSSYNYISDYDNALMQLDTQSVAITLSNDWCVKIAEPEIRDILITFFKVLGDNPEYIELTEKWENDLDGKQEYWEAKRDSIESSYAITLWLKWTNLLTGKLYKSESKLIEVLEEFNKILESKLK